MVNFATPYTMQEAADALPGSLHDLLEQRATESAGSSFLIVPESGYTLHFAAFREASRTLADALYLLGLRHGSRVALVLSNGIDAAVGIISVMAAGAVAVPINPQLAREEISWLLANCGADLLVTNADHRSSLPEEVAAREKVMVGGVEIFTLGVNAVPGAVPAPPPRGNDPALILYTSGTTGHPKGVVLTHGNLISNASYVARAHDLTSEDRALCVLPLYHINGLVVTLITPLLTGGSVLMPQRFRAKLFWEWVGRYRATWFSAVPTILSILLSHEQPPPEHLAQLRFARSASAPLPVAVLEEFEWRFGVPVIETYGISEAACQVCANPLPPLARKPGSAGIPVGNTLAVIDCHGRELPDGKVGEVVIRGKNVFSGYLDNPAADREALKDGWFHTGDLGFLDGDGYLFLTGRKKEQINRAGEKIAPREVEEVIHRLPAVEAVGVAGVPHDLYGEEVVAFVTPRQGQTLGQEEVRAFCQKHLALFKVPREVIFLAELPKGPSGKIQRRRLVEVYRRLKESAVQGYSMHLSLTAGTNQERGDRK